jgi:hypothetical protein
MQQFDFKIAQSIGRAPTSGQHYTVCVPNSKSIQQLHRTTTKLSKFHQLAVRPQIDRGLLQDVANISKFTQRQIVRLMVNNALEKVGKEAVKA